MVRFIATLLGSIKYVQVWSPDLEERLRLRYRSQIEQLNAQGFHREFSLGETFFLPSIVFVFPAIMLILMLLKREVLAMQPGMRIALCYPVFLSADRSTFAFPFGLGVKFYTAFQDGGLLVSETFEGCPADQSAVVVNQKSGSIAQTWSDHQNQMHALEQEGKVVDRQSSFEFFTQILPRG